MPTAVGVVVELAARFEQRFAARRSRPIVSRVGSCRELLGLERIEAQSLFAERLETIYRALDLDPVLIEETFPRAVRADRLSWQQAPLKTSKLEIRRREDGDAGEAAPNPDCRSDDTWDTSLMSVPGLAPMSGQVAVWTGHEIIVWANNRAGGARFDPLTGTRRFLPDVEGPDIAAAFWTGREMLLWGRIYASDEDGHAILKLGGALYDPVADSWRPVSPHIPVRGKNASAVWTGKELIVWGGDTSHPEASDDRLTAAGARYDPDADAWRPTSVAGAPSPREQHLAVWTGQEMIIWGGDDDEGPLSNGGRYDPATDSWSAMSAAGPQTDYDAAVVWTGQEMIVSGYQRAAYAPDTDTWRPLSTALAPFHRSGASLTRAGDCVILWGGWDSVRSKIVNTGSRYHPASDSWTPTSTLGAPSPRTSHNAVWTGEALIVWGGWSGSQGLHTGGVYSLDSDLDGDGFTRCQGDCDQASAAVHPGAAEIPGNMLDENCDGALLCDPRLFGNGQFQRCIAAECRREGADSVECREFLKGPASGRSCGNGIRNAREVCDGEDLGARTCQDLGFAGGILGCNRSCEFDTSGCTTVCGNGMREGGEICDGSDHGGVTCQSLGFEGGTLACHASCRGFDRDLCTTHCGDGVRRGVEACDGDDLGGRSCNTLGFDDGTLACSPGCDRLDTSACTTSCSDGVRRGTEICDGADMGQFVHCSAFAFFDEGNLTCHATCDGYDTSGCDRCGDGIKGGSEVCDQRDFGAAGCQDFGFEGGELTCNWDCSGWSISRCTGGCGNNIVEGTELCDGFSFSKCIDLGFDGGFVTCNPTCDAIDVTDCTVCGDGVTERTENCDPGDMGDRTCVTAGYDGGTLTCRSNCRGFDASGCTTVCGDGIRRGREICDGDDAAVDCPRPAYDDGQLACNEICSGFDFTPCTRCGDGLREDPEQCEGSDLRGQTCVSLGRGYVGGTLTCYSHCSFNIVGCMSDCGDGVVAGHESCDGNDLGGRSCQDLGFDEGALACGPNCFWDYSGCRERCGDGARGLGEVCDGADLNYRSCHDEGFDGGTLSCNALCDGYDTSGCTTCGDGRREGREVCDGTDVEGWTCRLFGYEGGVIGCSPSCWSFDETGCRP